MIIDEDSEHSKYARWEIQELNDRIKQLEKEKAEIIDKVVDFCEKGKKDNVDIFKEYDIAFNPDMSESQYQHVIDFIKNEFIK